MGGDATLIAMPGCSRRSRVGLAVVVTLGACGRVHPGPSKPQPTPTTTGAAAQSWDAQAATAFVPLTTALPNLDGVVTRWQAGAVSDADLRAGASAAVAQIVTARRAVEALPPFPYDSRANDLYRDSVILDLQAANTDESAADVPAGSALRNEVVLLGTRLRRLADRVFDRGRALVQPYLGPADPNVVVNLPEEVPNWKTEGLAAGPPLDPDAPSVRPLPGGSGELREPNRPTQSRAAWLDAVRAAGIPEGAAVATAIAGNPDSPVGSSAAGSALARDFLDAAERLRSTPDPVGDREGATRLRLGLLVDADAVYATRAASLAASDRLRDVGLRLAVVADQLWPADAGPRSSGFPTSLLSDDR